MRSATSAARQPQGMWMTLLHLHGNDELNDDDVIPTLNLGTPNSNTKVWNIHRAISVLLFDN